jgi:hypothetical protein
LCVVSPPGVDGAGVDFSRYVLEVLLAPPRGTFAQGDGRDVSLAIRTEAGQAEIELKSRRELMDKLEQLSFNRLVSCPYLITVSCTIVTHI